MAELSTDIAAPPSTVWEIWTDVERWPEWTASTTKVERLASGPLAVGSKVRIKQPRLPRVTWEVIDVDEPRRFSWRSRSPGYTAVGDHEITKLGEGVRVILRITTSGMLAGIMNRLTDGITRRYLQLEAEGLKRRAERVS